LVTINDISPIISSYCFFIYKNHSEKLQNGEALERNYFPVNFH